MCLELHKILRFFRLFSLSRFYRYKTRRIFSSSSMAYPISCDQKGHFRDSLCIVRVRVQLYYVVYANVCLLRVFMTTNGKAKSLLKRKILQNFSFFCTRFYFLFYLCPSHDEFAMQPEQKKRKQHPLNLQLVGMPRCALHLRTSNIVEEVGVISRRHKNIRVRYYNNFLSCLNICSIFCFIYNPRSRPLFFNI